MTFSKLLILFFLNYRYLSLYIIYSFVRMLKKTYLYLKYLTFLLRAREANKKQMDFIFLGKKIKRHHTTYNAFSSISNMLYTYILAYHTYTFSLKPTTPPNRTQKKL